MGEKYDFALFQNSIEGLKVNLDTIRFDKKKHLSVKNLIGTNPDDLDVSVLLPEGISGRQFLNIETPTNNQLFNKIIICGYPGGFYSFSEYKEIGIKLSPVMQFGRFTGLFPLDPFPTPWGIQTDIIGTGGSSGSPIIDLTNFKVIGIAQNVIPSKIFVDFCKNEFNGLTKVGLTYGLSSYYFYDVDNKITGHENEPFINYDREIYRF